MSILHYSYARSNVNFYLTEAGPHGPAFFAARVNVNKRNRDIRGHFHLLFIYTLTEVHNIISEKKNKIRQKDNKRTGSGLCSTIIGAIRPAIIPVEIPVTIV